MDHPRTAQGGPDRLPLAHRAVHRRRRGVPLRQPRGGAGARGARGRHAVRRRGRRALPRRAPLQLRRLPGEVPARRPRARGDRDDRAGRGYRPLRARPAGRRAARRFDRLFSDVPRRPPPSSPPDSWSTTPSTPGANMPTKNLTPGIRSARAADPGMEARGSRRTRERTLLALVLLLAAAPAAAGAQTDHATWNAVGRVLQAGPSAAAGDPPYNFPRRDIALKVGDVAVSPALVLGAWAGFAGTADSAVTMGDLGLLPAALKGDRKSV